MNNKIKIYEYEIKKIIKKLLIEKIEEDDEFIDEVEEKKMVQKTYSPNEVKSAEEKGVGIEVDDGTVTPTKDGGLKVTTMNEKFASKAQQRYFYAMADKPTKKGKKFKKMAKEFSDDTDFEKIPEKVSPKKNRKKGNKNPKMGKGELIEYIKSKKLITEQPGDVVMDMSNDDKGTVLMYLETLKKSKLVNMFGAGPFLTYTVDDLYRNVLSPKRLTPEDIENELEYEEDGDEIEGLEETLNIINKLINLQNKTRDSLIRTAMTRASRLYDDYDLKTVQRIFNKLPRESWNMWMIYYD